MVVTKVKERRRIQMMEESVKWRRKDKQEELLSEMKLKWKSSFWVEWRSSTGYKYEYWDLEELLATYELQTWRRPERFNTSQISLRANYYILVVEVEENENDEGSKQVIWRNTNIFKLWLTDQDQQTRTCREKVGELMIANNLNMKSGKEEKMRKTDGLMNGVP